MSAIEWRGWRRQESVGMPAPLRLLALGAALLVIGSFVGVLYGVVDVISHPDTFLAIVAVTLATTTVIARYLSVRRAVVIATVLLIGGLSWYLSGLSVGFALWPHLRYTIALLTGQSVLAIVNLEAWVLAVTPAPVFLTWYLTVRRRYVAGAVVGGATTLFFVLTGDAGPELTLLGVVGVVALVGLGELDRLEGSLTDADMVATIVALTILTSATVTLVPAGMGYTFSPDTGLESRGVGGAGTADTLEGNLLGVDENLQIVGSIELSSSVRYRVQSSDEAYWRVGAYDLYTGDGWIRQGENGPLDRRLGTPAGRSRTVEQTYRPLSDTRAMPAVWRPMAVTGTAAELVQVTSAGGLEPRQPLPANATYSVESGVPVATLAELTSRDSDYPASIRDRYTQLPDSTPDRVTERTERLTANAGNPYETARVIESWLKTNRQYSLNVSKPSGDIADKFLFEMERGYCTYYATTMAVMLRSQGVPARMVVGYTPGQRVGENEWIVRGHDAHAWVEVYFADVGWVRFDPTPAGPRETAEQSDLETARENNVSDVDTNDSQGGEWTPTPEEETAEEDAFAPDGTPSVRGNQLPVNATLPPGARTPNVPDAPNAPQNGTAADGDNANGEEGEGLSVGLPTAEQATLGALAILGLAGMARRTGLSRRAYRAVWLRYQPRRDPETDVERAFERLSAVLERRHRDRRQGESVRAYLDATDADDRARRVAAIRERARYAGLVDEDVATEAVELVDELVAE